MQSDAVRQYGWSNILQLGKHTAVEQYGLATNCTWAIRLGKTIRLDKIITFGNKVWKLVAVET